MPEPETLQQLRNTQSVRRFEAADKQRSDAEDERRVECVSRERKTCYENV